MNVEQKTKLTDLANSLIDKLLDNKGDFFSYTTVVTPNRNIRQWFKAYWLNKQSEILMNVNFVNLDEFVFSIFDTDYSLANSTDIKGIIIKLLSKETYDNTNSEIRDYLFDLIKNNHVLNHAKLYELAGTLTSLFMDYEREDFVSNPLFTGWQKDLYNNLLKELDKYKLTTISKLYKDGTKMNPNKKEVHVFGFLYLDKLYDDILKDYSKNNIVALYQVNEPKKLVRKYDNISSSPSLTKEIEVVHSKICELLKNKGNKPTDFVVVGSGMSDYENIIKKTFNQDDANFPYIPYSISGSKGEDSDLSIAMKLLIEVVNKGFVTRLDFYSLINNPLVKTVRNIDDDQIEKWMSSIYTLNVYRGGNFNDDDWDYIRKRVLLSKISDVSFDDNVVKVNGKDTIPYSLIGLDNDSIVALVKVIDDLKSWFDLFKTAKTTDKNLLLKLKAELQKWFLNSILTKIDKRYKKVDDLINIWMDRDIVAPIDTLLFSLLDAAKLTSISYREPFTTGVTFVEFNELVTYGQKYVFFINCGANTLPGKKIKSELDLRLDPVNNDKEKCAFRCQYENAEAAYGDGAQPLYISFINCDLKKDAELFESTFSKDIRETILKEENPQNSGEPDKDYKDRITKLMNDENIKHSIDETRNWQELYSRGEYNKKDYREGLSSIVAAAPIVGNATPVNPEQEEQEIRKKVSVSDLAKLLKEPLSARAGYLFGSEDDSNEKNHAEFEGFGLSGLESYAIISSLSEKRAKNALENPGVPYDTTEFEEQLHLENKLPHINDDLGQISFDYACDSVGDLLGVIGIEGHPQDYEILRLQDLLLNCNGQEWTLTCNRNFVRKEIGNEITYYEFKMDNDDFRSKYLILYIISLMDVASRKDTVEYSITLNRFSNKAYTVTCDKATDILNDLFELLNNFKDPHLAYLDFRKIYVTSFNKLVEYIRSDNGPWKYFSYGKLFDADTEIGYDKNNYKEAHYYDEQNAIIEHIEYEETVAPDPNTVPEEDD